jgi:hypothetical protein
MLLNRGSGKILLNKGIIDSIPAETAATLSRIITLAACGDEYFSM